MTNEEFLAVQRRGKQIYVRQRIESLAALLRLHRCNVDGRQTVGECIEAGRCGCSCGLLVPQRAAVRPRFDLAAQVAELGADSLLPPEGS